MIADAERERALLLLLGSFVAPAAALGAFDAAAASGDPPTVLALGTFVFYVLAYFVAIFFNTALVGAAMIRMDGGNPTLRDGLAIAWSRVGRIFGYAVIAATVGLLLRALEERVGWVGQLVLRLVGVAWTLATFLVVPVLVTRDVGPIDAVKESAALLRETWGENLIGTVGLGFAAQQGSVGQQQLLDEQPRIQRMTYAALLAHQRAVENRREWSTLPARRDVGGARVACERRGARGRRPDALLVERHVPRARVRAGRRDARRLQAGAG